MAKVDVSFIVISWNACDLTLECLHSIFDNVHGVSFEVVLVDNASSDGTAEIVHTVLPTVRVLVNHEHQGFAAANNRAIRQAGGRYLALMNNDAKLTPKAIETIIEFMESEPNVGAAGPQLLNEDGSKQNSIAAFPSLATELLNKTLLHVVFPGRYPSKYFGHDRPIDVDSIIGACMVLRADAMGEIGGFDEDYYFFLEETDLCFRLKQHGWRVCHVPQAEVYHYKGASAERRPGAAARIEYCRSLYKFFEKNRKPVEHRALQALYAVKLAVEFLARAYACVLTLGCHRQSRRRLKRYWNLIIWHFRLCPDSEGFGGEGSRRSKGHMEGEA
ncbi:MAG: glycosyltransferase family 2 protein [Planctomycetes bacterium]|nr:glycosyltransferase family 2 protein [Planctomycetota bacterium]